MNTEEMLQEVDRRVADGLVEHLLPKAIHRHSNSKKTFRDCDCSFCKAKWKATSDIANMKFPLGYSPEDRFSIFEHDYEYWEIKRFRRDGIRNFYREKLKELIND